MNIYFSGIGGVGLGPLAEIARDAGYSVQGSDQSESLMTQQLSQAGITVDLSHDGAYLRACHQAAPIDWFAYSTALPDNHPELQIARELGIKITKRDELLARIIEEKQLKLIAVSGTHGKTTTTGMMIWAMKQLGVPVSYSVGTSISFGPSGLFDPESKYFIYECDEFDRNFLHFSPSLALITSLGYDHTDTYKSVDEYKAAFHDFLNQSDEKLIWQRDASYLNYRDEKAWILQPSDIAKISIAGEHNRRNATLVLKALEKLGLSHESSLLESFPGTARRFEKLADNLYSDYGHHPAEIAATLQMAREISDHVVIVYQPHQNVRQHEIKDQYIDCFGLADKVYWLPTYLSREDPSLEILTPESLSKDVSTLVKIVELGDELWDIIEKERDAGKLVLSMGAGSIDEWLRKQLSYSR